MPSKDNLRAHLLPRLTATAPAERNASSQQLCAHLLDQSIVATAPALALYAAYDWELDLTAVAEATLARDALLHLLDELPFRPQRR